MSKILVTGGLGYIGSHTVVELCSNGYEVVIVDYLSNSSLRVLDGIESITKNSIKFLELDLKNLELTESFIKSNNDIDGVIHFAASKAVGESVDDPLKYYNAILKFANNSLELNGKIYFEINEYLYNDMKELLLNFGYTNINIKKDTFKKNRFISAILKKRNK